MDPESFFNWDTMDDDMELFEGSSFLSSNFDRSAFTDAIIHPSLSEMTNSKRKVKYEEFEDEMGSGKASCNYQQGNEGYQSGYNHTNQPGQQFLQVKQEPGVTNVQNNFFNDYYAPSPSFVSPAAVTPHAHHYRNNNHIQQFQTQPSSPAFQTKVFHEEKQQQQQQYIPPSSPFTSGDISNSASRYGDTGAILSGRAPENEIDVVIKEQPPVEVRTRTPGENRTFSLKAVVMGNFKSAMITAVSVKLLYANSDSPPPRQTILGGTKAVPISDDGIVVFDTLCMTEASTKHAEKEFCLEFYYIQSDGKETSSRRTSNPFYAYSHKKVLTRRKNISLRALSKSYGPVTGGGEYHIVGTPFIKGPSLKCLICTSHGSVEIKYSDGSLERYSETVLFFRLPSYPHPDAASMKDGEIKVSVQVTNDGRHYSNELPFVYLPQNRCPTG